MMKNMIRLNKNSFRFKIACYYLLASLFVMILLSSIIYMVISQMFVKESINKTKMAIDVSSNNVGEVIHHKKSVLELYASNQDVQAYIQGDTKLNDQILSQLKEIKNSDHNIVNVFLSLQDGKVLSVAHNKVVENYENITIETPCFINNQNRKDHQDDPWVVTLAVPIIDDNHHQLGVIGLDLDYCFFSRTLNHLNLGKKSAILIQDQTDKLVFNSNQVYQKKHMDKVGVSKQYQNGFDQKRNTLTYQASIPNTKWIMIGNIYLQELSVLKRQLFDIVVFITIILSCVVGAITILLSRKLTDPILRLTKGMEDIKQLKELSVSEQEISETAILTTSYNHMIYKIKDLMNELQENQEALRNAEFDALTSQMNPHFLYNTLDTIVWLAEFKDNEKIISLTKSLALFFRLSLNGGKSVVSLEDEIEHVKQYLLIQKERYGDKFDYFFTIDHSLLNYSIPKITLQPIVENAIYHGIKPMDQKGMIHIQVEKIDSYLRICVSDNGVGVEASKQYQSIPKVSSGVGLKNVEKRIQLFYGESSKITIISSDQGTDVILLLDIEKEKK